MDPNANLLEQRRILHRRTCKRCKPFAGDSGRLRDLREALDGWIAGGGFRPTIPPGTGSECPNK